MLKNTRKLCQTEKTCFLPEICMKGTVEKKVETLHEHYNVLDNENFMNSM